MVFRMCRVSRFPASRILALMACLWLTSTTRSFAAPPSDCATIRTTPGSVHIITMDQIPGIVQADYNPATGDGSITLRATEYSTGDSEEKTVRFGSTNPFAGLHSVLAAIVPQADGTSSYMTLIAAEAVVELSSPPTGPQLAIELNVRGTRVTVRAVLGSATEPQVECVRGAEYAPRYALGTFPFLLGLATKIENAVAEYNTAQANVRSLRTLSGNQQAELARLSGEVEQFRQITQQQAAEIAGLNGRITSLTSETDGLKNLVSRYELLVSKLQAENGKLKVALELRQRIYEMLAKEAFRLIRQFSRNGLENATEVSAVKGLSRTLNRIEQTAQQE